MYERSILFAQNALSVEMRWFLLSLLSYFNYPFQIIRGSRILQNFL